MLATEYGKLATKISVWLDDKSAGTGLDIDIAVQGVSSANRYSPKGR